MGAGVTGLGLQGGVRVVALRRASSQLLPCPLPPPSASSTGRRCSHGDGRSHSQLRTMCTASAPATAVTAGTTAGSSSSSDSGGCTSQSTAAVLRQGRRRFRVLSLDGGGVRGLFSAVVLQRLAEQEPRLLESVDLIAGTSTGAVIGSMLALGHSPADVARLYEEMSSQIFTRSWLRRLSPVHANYSDVHRDAIFRKYAGGTTFADVKQWLLVTAFNLDGIVPDQRTTFFPAGRWRPALFSNMPRMAGEVEPDLQKTIHEALMASTAAPIFMPTHGGYCDGGVVANNPSLCAMSKVLAHVPGLSHQDLSVLSIGTSVCPHKVSSSAFQPHADWGLAQWSSLMLELLFDSNNRNVNLHMSHFLGSDYHRINPLLSDEIALDDTSAAAMAQLRAIAMDVELQPTLDFVRKHFLSQPPATLVDWTSAAACDQLPVGGLDQAAFAEVMAQLQLGISTSPANVESLFAELDTNGDGIVSGREIVTLLAQHANSGRV
jgi:hypothetical protein